MRPRHDFSSLPTSAKQRGLLQENHEQLLANLFLQFNRDYEVSLRMHRSSVTSLFNSQAFAQWQKSREVNQKIDLASIERLDMVIKSIGNLSRALARGR